MTSPVTTERVHGYCALCVSRCGSVAVVEDGRFVALEPDASHPTGKALCAKGRAAPELVYHPDRLRYPLKRTRPKGDTDPGWQRIGWDEALALTADALKDIAATSGPENVAFSLVSPSTSSSEDSVPWVERLMAAFGSPNLCGSMELCGWGRYYATSYTFGASVPGRYMPDLENAGCILFWGYNPNHARLVHATATVAAQKRGAKLIVVDPRLTEPARRADLWLRVRPGTDAALALGIANVMFERGWYDREFLRDWTNGPLLVRDDDGRLLREAELRQAGDPARYVFRTGDGLSEPYQPAAVHFRPAVGSPLLFGKFQLQAQEGAIACRTALERVRDACASYPPEKVEEITGVPRDQVIEAARLIWEERPLAYYAWSGVEMQTNSTQIARAIAQLSILSASLDVPGGNVLFAGARSSDIGRGGLPSKAFPPALGSEERPLGPSRWHHITSDELYRGILDGQPYKVRGLVGFGSNLLLSHADGNRGRDALSKLEFYAHADLFMNPTAEMADVVLPVASAFEREGLRIGFEVSEEAQSLVQLRSPVVPPLGEARSDMQIVFDLAVQLGLGEHFWNGDTEAAYRHQLAPSGVTLETLRQNPGGVRAPVETRYRKYAELDGDAPRGFETPSRRIELYSETLLGAGYPPVPEFVEPPVSPVSQPDLAARYPLVLTCAKNHLYCESQHRALPSLRRKSMYPEVELHPQAAAARGIEAGDWVRIETPKGSVRARAALNESLDPLVVCGEHGWWQACDEIGAPGYDAFSPEGANFNLIIGSDAIDPVSGSVPHRAYLCQVSKVDSAEFDRLSDPG
jgi:anaerobic selenocysteine-containing dehydrogenase